MVDERTQLRHVVDNIFEAKSRREVNKYLYGMSCSLSKNEDGTRQVNIFSDNRFDFIKSLLGVETQHCHQILSWKKIKRLKKNMDQGYFVFIRDYDPEHEDVEDFSYKRIQRIYPSILGWRLELSDGETISRASLNGRYKKAFRKYLDWGVYEDVTFFMHESQKAQEVEEKYIKRMAGRMRCIALNKARSTMDPEDTVHVTDIFFDQRQKVYKVLTDSRWIKRSEKRQLSESLSKYGKKTISLKELYECFDLEYQVLRAMEERINEERDRNRIRDFRNDLCMRTG